MKLSLNKIRLAGVVLLALITTNAFSNESTNAIQKGQVMPEASGSAKLVLTIDGIRKHAGSLRIGLYNSETGRNAGRAIGGVNATVAGDVVVVEFDGLADGQYAINLFHDQDSNGEMNTNLFGIPSEPYAFSNNAKGNFGPAKWQDAAFEIAAGDNTHTITMFK